MSGRSSRSTLMLTNSSFITAAVASSSKLSCAMTWHQWQEAEATDSTISLLAVFAFGQSRRPPGPPVNRIVLMLQEIRAGLLGETVFVCGVFVRLGAGIFVNGHDCFRSLDRCVSIITRNGGNGRNVAAVASVSNCRK